MRILAIVLFILSGLLFLAAAEGHPLLSPPWGFALGAFGMAAHAAEDL